MAITPLTLKMSHARILVTLFRQFHIENMGCSVLSVVQSTREHLES